MTLQIFILQKHVFQLLSVWNLSCLAVASYFSATANRRQIFTDNPDSPDSHSDTHEPFSSFRCQRQEIFSPLILASSTSLVTQYCVIICCE